MAMHVCLMSRRSCIRLCAISSSCSFTSYCILSSQTQLRFSDDYCCQLLEFVCPGPQVLPPRWPRRRGGFAHMHCESLSHRRQEFFFSPLLGANPTCYSHEALDCFKETSITTRWHRHACRQQIAFIIVRDKWP